LEPAVPQEYILKGVVNAALGQEMGSVKLTIVLYSMLAKNTLFISEGASKSGPAVFPTCGWQCE